MKKIIIFKFLIFCSILSFGQKITTVVHFATAPTSATAVVPNLKFDKQNWFSLEFDDASNSAATALSILNNAHYTDGCGNNINYKFALAINGANTTTGAVYNYDGSNPSQTTKTIMFQLLAAGGDIEDHSYWHDPVDYGAGVSALTNTTLMQDFISNLLTGYKVRAKVVPSNNAGHAQAAYDRGYLYSTSEGTFDPFTPVGLYTALGDYDLVPTFGALRRDFTDVWNTSLSGLKTNIDLLLTKTNWFYRLGSHTINDETAFQSFIDYIEDNADDKLLVATTREIMEYREMANLPIIQNIVGNDLIIEVDYSTLSASNRWRDLSFKITSDQPIQYVSTNATSSSFNSSTGLVNIFKQSTDTNTPNLPLPKGRNFKLN